MDRLGGTAPPNRFALYVLMETDSERHEQHAGVSNELSLDNVRHLVHDGTRVMVRWPVVAKCNDVMKSIHDLARIARLLETVDQIGVLLSHRMGRSKDVWYNRAVVPSDLSGC